MDLEGGYPALHSPGAQPLLPCGRHPGACSCGCPGAPPPQRLPCAPCQWTTATHGRGFRRYAAGKLILEGRGGEGKGEGKGSGGEGRGGVEGEGRGGVEGGGLLRRGLLGRGRGGEAVFVCV